MIPEELEACKIPRVLANQQTDSEIYLTQMQVIQYQPGNTLVGVLQAMVQTLILKTVHWTCVR